MVHCIKSGILTLALFTAVSSNAQTPRGRPLPDLADSAALTRALDSLKREGGAQSDRAVFLRWMNGTIVRIMSNGMRGIPRSELPATVGDAIQRQKRTETLLNDQVEKNRIRSTQGRCEAMLSSSNPSFWVGFGGGYNIGGKHYADPCEALRANGLPELDDSEEAVRARSNQKRIRDQARSEDEELMKRWREEFGRN